MWHYTVAIRALEILESGALLPGNRNIPKGKPVLWFSSNPTWENSCNWEYESPVGVLTRLNQRQTQLELGGLFRFSAPLGTALIKWPDIGWMAGLSSDDCISLADWGASHGAKAMEWAGVMHQLPIKGLSFQALAGDGSHWLDMPQDAVLIRKILNAQNLDPGDFTTSHKVMTTSHHRFEEFALRMVEAMTGAECQHNFDACFEVLNVMRCDIDNTLEYFRYRGAHCDCEVMLNVIDWQKINGKEDE